MLSNQNSGRRQTSYSYLYSSSIHFEFDNHIQLPIKCRKLVIVVQYFQIVVSKVKTSLKKNRNNFIFHQKKCILELFSASKIKLFESCNQSCIQFMVRCLKIFHLRFHFTSKVSKIFFKALISVFESLLTPSRL